MNFTGLKNLLTCLIRKVNIVMWQLTDHITISNIDNLEAKFHQKSNTEMIWK